MTASDTQATSGDLLAQRLGDPQVSQALASILDRADLLAILLTGLDALIARGEVIGDNLAGSVDEMRRAVAGQAQGADVGALISAGTSLVQVLPQAAPRLVSAVESGALDKLLATAEVSAEALDQVELLARGVVAGSEDFARQPMKVGGPVSLVKILKDPDVNRAISYFATIAKAVGRELGRTSPAPSASTSSAATAR